jgi:hypothetical protein
MKHKHKVVEQKTVGWTTCVDPKRCTSPELHGCVVVVQKCTCGLYREVEAHAGRQFRGRWTDRPKNWHAW